MNQNHLSHRVEKLAHLKERLERLATSSQDCRDEHFGRLACSEAWSAAVAGNYGVGALIVDPVGEIVARGQNHAFFPQFQSSRHAEMVVMDRFEEMFPNVTTLAGYELYVSLEPCPMCVGRLVISGIATVKYVAADPKGGMVNHLNDLPAAFQNLAKSQRFVPAACSTDLQAIATSLFLFNLEELRAKLFARRS